jgi:hypothetical protein
MAIVLIGIDDTDNHDDTTPGTAKLSRRLVGELESRGARSLGISRHQFLLDQRIRCTLQNRGACLAIEWDGSLTELEFAADLIAEWSAQGSNPGICIASSDQCSSAIMKWGWSAMSEVLTRDRAMAIAHADGVNLRPLGGTGDGVIGALAGVGLRADGNEGWFHDLPGLRSLGEFVELGELARIGIEVDHRLTNTADSKLLQADGTAARYKTLNWVRPRLIDGRAVWPVEWSEDEHVWIPVDRKRSRPLE